MISLIQATLAPKSRISFSVRSIYGRDTISPVSVSFSPLVSAGPIISKAEIYCELTFPGKVTSLFTSLRPTMRNGGKPSLPAYSTSAPSARSALTSMLIGRLLHTLCSGYDVCAFAYGKKSRQETHGRTGRHNVDDGRHVLQSLYHHPCVVAVGQVFRVTVSFGKGIDYQCTVADAFR